MTEPALFSASADSSRASLKSGASGAAAAAPSFFQELKDRERATTRSVWVDHGSTVLLHPKSAVLDDVPASPDRLSSPTVGKGFHVSSAVAREVVHWQRQRDDGTFVSYSDGACAELEKRFRQGKPFARLIQNGVPHDIMFKSLVEVCMGDEGIGRTRMVGMRCSAAVCCRHVSARHGRSAAPFPAAASVPAGSNSTRRSHCLMSRS